MKRRSFLSLSALSAVPVAARAADVEDGWWETINEDALEFKAVAEEGKITLQVELMRPAEHEVTEALDEKGEHRCYQYKGKDQPYPFRPGVNLVKRFDLTWDGKAMQIPERFWNDLTRARPSRPRPFGARQPPAASCPKRLQAFAVFAGPAHRNLHPQSRNAQTRNPLEGGALSRKPPSATRLPLRRRWHRPHRRGTRRGMRLKLHHPLDRQQVRRRSQTPPLPAA